MRPIVHPELVNTPFRDPVLYLDFLFEKRALLFDVGDIRALMPRQLLRVSHVFVSHTHMDHFADFDWLLRVCLGRDMTLRMFGPEGFIERVASKLGAYTWNLVRNYDADLRLEVAELHEHGPAPRALFSCRTAFRLESLEQLPLHDGLLVDDTAFCVRAAVLDHGGIPCLGFAFEEKLHVNIWKNRLEELGLPTGPWLGELKRAVLAGAADDTPIRAWWRQDGAVREHLFALGELKARTLQIVPGMKLGYLVDFADTPANRHRAIGLVRGADRLYIETPFRHEEAHLAARKAHLTAHQAGRIAREAGVAELFPIHFSPRNTGREREVVAEAMAAFAGSRAGAAANLPGNC